MQLSTLLQLIALLQQTAQQVQNPSPYIPLWVAVVGAITSVVVSLGIGAIILWFLNWRKYSQEVKGQEIKNDGETIRNLDFQNKAYGEIYDTLKKERDENVRLDSQVRELTKDLEIKKMQVAEAQGATKLALSERDTVYDRIEVLEDQIIFDKNEHQQKILELGQKYEDDLRDARAQVDFLMKLITEHGLEIPPIQLIASEVKVESDS